MHSLSRPYPFNFFKGCPPHILLGPFLNILSHLRPILDKKNVENKWTKAGGNTEKYGWIDVLESKKTNILRPRKVGI